MDAIFNSNKELGKLVNKHLDGCDDWQEGKPVEIFRREGIPCVKYESGRWWFYDLLTWCWWPGGASTVTSSSEWGKIFQTLPVHDIVALWNAYRIAMDESEPYHDTVSPVGYFLFEEYDENNPIDRMLGVPSWLREDPSREAKIRWYVRAGRKGFEERVSECVAYFWEDAFREVVDFNALAKFLSKFKYPPESVLGLAHRNFFAFEAGR